MDGKWESNYMFNLITKYLPDKSNWLNFMYVICDEIEPVLIRFEHTKILPISWKDQRSS